MAIANKIQNFAFVGIKDLLVYSRETGALIADIDKLVNISLTDNLQVDYLRAGYGNQKIMSIFGDRECQLSASVGTMSMELIEIMTGSPSLVKTKSMDEVEVLDIISNKVTLKEIPSSSAVITVYKLDQYGKSIKPALEKVSSAPIDNQFAVSSKDVTFKTGTSGKVKVVYKYDKEIETVEAKDIKPRSYKMTGMCVVREIESGKLYKGQIEIPNGSIVPNTSIGAKNDAGVPDAIDLQIDMMVDALLQYPYALNFIEE